MLTIAETIDFPFTATLIILLSWKSLWFVTYVKYYFSLFLFEETIVILYNIIKLSRMIR
jgi:hypothetical protein